MYFAVNQDAQSFEAYLSFLNEILNSNNQRYIDVYREVIEQTQVLLKSKDYYKVSSERFGIVKYFSTFPEVINSIDSNNIQREDYTKLVSCLEKELCIAS